MIPCAMPRRSTLRLYCLRSRSYIPGARQTASFHPKNEAKNMAIRALLSTARKALPSLVAIVALAGAARADVLDDIKTNGVVKCGVTLSAPGFSAENPGADSVTPHLTTPLVLMSSRTSARAAPASATMATRLGRALRAVERRALMAMFLAPFFG